MLGIPSGSVCWADILPFFKASVLAHLLCWALVIPLLCSSVVPAFIDLFTASSMLYPLTFTRYLLTTCWIYLFQNFCISLRMRDGLVSFTLMAHNQCSINTYWMNNRNLWIFIRYFTSIDISKMHVLICAQVDRYGQERESIIVFKFEAISKSTYVFMCLHICTNTWDYRNRCIFYYQRYWKNLLSCPSLCSFLSWRWQTSVPSDRRVTD